LSDSPGNELRDFFGSDAASNPASRNYAGIASPVIDQIIELIIAASDRKQLVERTRALDRVLLARRYVIPNWHLSATRMLYWNKFGLPDVIPSKGPVINTWWLDQEKAQQLERAQQQGSVITESRSDRQDFIKEVKTAEDSRNIAQSDSGSDFSWFSAIFPLLVLTAEIALVVKLHRFLNRNSSRSSTNDLSLTGNEQAESQVPDR